MIVNKNKITIDNLNCRRIQGLEKFLEDNNYDDWVYLPSRDKYQIELANIIIELYCDDSLEFSSFIKPDANMYCDDFVELINKLIKNEFMVEE